MPKGKNSRGRRQYSDELKAEAVQMLLDGHSAESVVSRLGLSGTCFIVGRRICSRPADLRRRRWRLACRNWKRNCAAWSRSETS